MTAAGITLSAQSAQALNFTLAPGDFSIIQGIGDNNSSSTIAINTSAPANGFGNVFTSTFLLLGANTTDANIPNDSLKNNNSVARSIPFAVSVADVAQPITMTFNWAFNGDSSGGFNDKDSFNIAIIKTDNSNGAQLFERTVDPSDAIPGYGFGINDIGTLIAANTLSAGNYQIFISLNENTDFSNRSSAAGFNNIILSTPGTPVPFGFSTNMSLLVFGGMFYGMNKLKKKMAVKKFQA
ncbi:hypothetical protein H6G59_11720 [Anabaena lutea FACHB-196]|uniref:PEP-CTERM sorting domain-containing protein n=2 Tax=Anabaena TaxID=1163 RepID=A0ABR8FEC9_9NOST|nr:hypothetical protein [Anabaena lutea FACHB-196]